MNSIHPPASSPSPDARAIADAAAVRIFAGIKIAEEIARELAALARPLESCGARLVRSEDIHLTLVPPWNETDVAGAVDKLRRATGAFGSLLLTFVHLGYGPTLRHPRLLWVDCVAGRELANLWAALMSAYGQTESRPFRPHVTLARLPRDGRLIARENPIDQDLRLTQHVTSVELFQSPPRGQRGYRVVASVPLGPIPCAGSRNAAGADLD